MGGRGRNPNQAKFARAEQQTRINTLKREYGHFVPRQRNWQDVKQQQQPLANQAQHSTNDMGLVTDDFQYSNIPSIYGPTPGDMSIQGKPIMSISNPLDTSLQQSTIDGSQLVDGGASTENGILDENGKLRFNEIFKTRKKPSVRAKEKKLRQNRQLRRAMFPKNALMAMNELKGLKVTEFTFTVTEGGGFTAMVTVNDKQHEGTGSSKAAAKNAACESVLRDFVISKMIQKPRQAKRSKTNSVSSNTNDPEAVPGDMDCDDTQSIADSQKSSSLMEDGDELPMVNLASFALYKLFSEWERAGYVVPEMHPHDYDATQQPPAGEPAPPKKPTNRTELPKDWEHMHPATLLCMMRPGLSYSDYGSSGDKNNISHRIGVVVDGKEFVETGRSKKIARKNVATQVCNELFGTNFVKEDPAIGTTATPTA